MNDVGCIYRKAIKLKFKKDEILCFFLKLFFSDNLSSSVLDFSCLIKVEGGIRFIVLIKWRYYSEFHLLNVWRQQLWYLYVLDSDQKHLSSRMIWLKFHLVCKTFLNSEQLNLRLFQQNITFRMGNWVFLVTAFVVLLSVSKCMSADKCRLTCIHGFCNNPGYCKCDYGFVGPSCDRREFINLGFKFITESHNDFSRTTFELRLEEQANIQSASNLCS